MQLQAALEQAAAAAKSAADEAAAALGTKRAALAESRREIDVLTAAAGAEKDTALAALKVPLPVASLRAWFNCGLQGG